MKALLASCAIVAGWLVLAALLPSPTVPPRAARHAPHVDVPWPSREVTAQLVGDDGGPGPLFAGAYVGGPAPAAAVRERIAAFARANHVAIALDVDDDGMLAAIRIELTYGGCCGYEGVDVLALRLQRPHIGGGCTCADYGSLPNDWAFTTDDGVHGRVRARVGTIGVRWEPELSLPELLVRADSLLGQRAADVRETARDRWIEVGSHLYLLELPYHFGELADHCSVPSPVHRDDLGVQVTTEHGRISAVSFVLGDDVDPFALRVHGRAIAAVDRRITLARR